METYLPRPDPTVVPAAKEDGDIIQVPRPFISKYWPELAGKTDSAWNDSKTLQLILAELLFRRRTGARNLRKKVTERLIQISQNSFLWPSTAVLPGHEALDGDQFWYTDGLLSFMGYRVGQNGVPASHRHDILDYVYQEQLPRVNSSDYMKPWGAPKSKDRLRKMAESIATFTRNAKRKISADLSSAITDWEDDLGYLKRTFYDGQYDNFLWPTTEVTEH